MRDRGTGLFLRGAAFAAIGVSGWLVLATWTIRNWTFGGWPPHDSIAFWLAGRHLLEGGSEVYANPDGAFLAFWYAPPWAVIFAIPALFPPEVLVVGLYVGQVLGLRYVCGSWLWAGAACWLEPVWRAVGTGNMDLIMAAAILAGIRGHVGPPVLMAFAKVGSILTVRDWRRLVWWSAMLVGITVPWLFLWPEWIVAVLGSENVMWLEPWTRAVPVLVLLALRRPWATAAAAGLAVPAFYYHSLVLLLPAVRLAVEARLSAGAGGGWPTRRSGRRTAPGLSRSRSSP